MRKRIVTALVAVLLVGAVATPFALSQYRKYEVRRVVTRYCVLLAEGLETLRPEIISEVAGLEEVSRVGSYATHLWGNNILLESELLELEVLRVDSAEDTMTASVSERWRFHERDRKSGKPLGDPWEEVQELDYTLVRREGELIVERARITSIPKDAPQ